MVRWNRARRTGSPARDSRFPPPAHSRRTRVNLHNDNRKRVVVIGGGITALAAAHRLVELDAGLRVTLLEAGPRLGGVLETVRRDGFLIEHSADNFITDPPWAVDLCRRIGFADQLIPTTSQQREAMVVHRGRLERVPDGFMLMAPARIWPLMTTPILSPWGKLRLLGERLVPPRSDDADESLGAFARRRLGRETFERIVQPLVGGIYTADPEKLSLRATLPRFIEMERRHGSLTRAARRQRGARPNGGADTAVDTAGGARYGLFVAPRDGVSSLVEAIAAKTARGHGACELAGRIAGAPCGRIVAESRVAATAAGGQDMACDAVIVAIGAPTRRRLLAPVDRDLAGELSRIPYAGTAIVTLGLSPPADRAPARRLWIRRAGDRKAADPGRQLCERKVPGPRPTMPCWCACSSAGPAKAN